MTSKRKSELEAELQTLDDEWERLDRMGGSGQFQQAKITKQMAVIREELAELKNDSDN